MQPMIRVPRIIDVNSNYIKLETPSKSAPGIRQTVTYWSTGKHHCECEGHYWFMKKGLFENMCRHCKMSTVFPSSLMSGPLAELMVAMDVLKDRVLKAFVAWHYIRCQFPEHYEPGALMCRGCPMYPVYCNIHPIKYSARGTRKPLVWRLQTAIYAGEKKRARKLLRQYVKKLKELK